MFRRKEESSRRDKDYFNRVKGLPWEPTPGSGSVEVRARFKPSGGEGEGKIEEPTLRESTGRDMYIRKKDVIAYGFTPGRKGRSAVNRENQGCYTARSVGRESRGGFRQRILIEPTGN